MTLPKNPYQGTFITVDGPDGCGKSTQLELLKELYEWETEVVFTKEPGKDRPWGSRIYTELANSREDSISKKDPFAFQTWYAHDGKDHSDRIIIPNLRMGNVVVSDRWRSSLNYAVFGNNEEEKTIETAKLMNMNRAILGLSFVYPDALLFFNTNTDLCLERLAKKGRLLDVFENHSTIDRVRENYLLFAKIYPNCYVIDGNRSAMEVFCDVERVVFETLQRKSNI